MTCPDLISANGRDFPLQSSGAGAALFVLFPGLRYRLGAPGLAMMRALAAQSGAECWGIATDYDQDARLAGRTQAQSVALIGEDSRQIIAQLPERPLVFVGKSVGCLALMEARHMRPDARLIWMTPNLTHEPMRDAIGAGRSFVIFGSEDPVTRPDLVRGLGCPHHGMLGLDHGLGGSDLPASQARAAQGAASDWLTADLT